MGKRVADMTPEQLERKRARNRVAGMTLEQLGRLRARQQNRAANMTAEELERKRARGRKENLTQERRARGRKENLTQEQLKRRRLTACSSAAEINAKKAPDVEVFMLNKIDAATRRLECTYRIPSTCPPELAAKLAPVLEMLKTADAAQRAAIRGVVRTMRAARELELLESVAQ